MKLPHDMLTLTEAIEMAREKGYTKDFSATKNGFESKETNEDFNPEELTITKVFRFEGISDPNDMSVLYLIKSDSGAKGIFIDAFGAYGDFDPQDLAKILQKIKIAEDHF
jgi:hypothetical protein